MSSRLDDINEIIRIGDEDTEFIERNKEYFCSGGWLKKQDGAYDEVLKKTFGSFFAFSKTGTIQELFKKIDDSTLEPNARVAWLDESFISTCNGVKENPDDTGDWDFECQGIQFDLKNSVLPKNFGNYRTSMDIISNSEQFIRDMFFESSKYNRANPKYHKQSNRFFMIYYSKKDKNYFNSYDRINTEFLKLNYKAKRKIFDEVFREFDRNIHVFNLKDVEYHYYDEIHKYDEVNCVICLVGEQENGEIKHYLVKN